jgi:hypothetical protein
LAGAPGVLVALAAVAATALPLVSLALAAVERFRLRLVDDAPAQSRHRPLAGLPAAVWLATCCWERATWWEVAYALLFWVALAPFDLVAASTLLLASLGLVARLLLVGPRDQALKDRLLALTRSRSRIVDTFEASDVASSGTCTTGAAAPDGDDGDARPGRQWSWRPVRPPPGSWSGGRGPRRRACGPERPGVRARRADRFHEPARRAHRPPGRFALLTLPRLASRAAEIEHWHRQRPWAPAMGYLWTRCGWPPQIRAC